MNRSPDRIVAPTDFDLDTMALTLWGEARGEPKLGQRAVAWVIRNRWETPGWWSRRAPDGIPDGTIAAVCRAPWQFSCWDKSDPQRPRMIDPDTLRRVDVQALRALCDNVLSASVGDDPTLGADHYCTVAVAPITKWARGSKPTGTIGGHVFFRLGLSGSGR